MALTKNNAPSSAALPSFMRTGADAKKLIETAEARDEQRAAERGKLFRFYIPKTLLKEDIRVTFLDGDVTEEGMLDIPLWEEHTVYHAGQWQNFIAPTDEPDPIKEKDSKDPSLVGGLTIIDHHSYPSRDGTKNYKDKRKLFIPKRKSLAILTKIAVKRGGLTGATFDISRSNEDAASVGDMFDFVEKKSMEELVELYGEEATPADWSKELTYYDRAQLIKMGLGAGGSKVGGSGPSKDLSAEM